MIRSIPFQPLAEWFLRIALALGFFSALADRFGLWGAPGSAGVAWGDWTHFRAYSDHLNFWMPEALRPPAAGTATLAEFALGVGLLAPWRNVWIPAAAGMLLLTFALSMVVTLGPKPPFDYSVFTAAAASFLLAAISRSQPAHSVEVSHEPI
jgi:putative oxidoreductase